MNETRPSRRPRRVWRGRLRPLRHWLTAIAFEGLMWFCQRISHRRAVGLGRWAGGWTYWIARRERERALKHLEMAFGKELTPTEREAIARGVFETVAMNLTEGLNSFGWSDAYYREVVDFKGLEHAEAALAGGRGVIFMGAHFGSWEIMPRPVQMQLERDFTVVMLPQRNKRLSAAIEKLRARTGLPVVASDASPLSFIRILRKGGIIGMLADQDTKHRSGIHVEFFGRPAYTPAGPAFLTRKTGAAMLTVLIHRHEDDPTRHTIEFYPPIERDMDVEEDEDVKRMLQEYISIHEGAVRETPGEWVWMHERWRHRVGHV